MKYLFQILLAIAFSLVISFSGVYALTKIPVPFKSEETQKHLHPVEKKENLFDPVEINEHYSLGLSYITNGDYNMAINCFNKVIEMDSSYDRAYLQLAKAYDKAQSPEKAKAYYNYYLKLHPNNHQVYLALYNLKKQEDIKR